MNSMNDVGKYMMPMMGMVMVAAILQMVMPTASYCCPICSVCFYTYGELYDHFVIGHPSEPIDIIWS